VLKKVAPVSPPQVVSRPPENMPVVTTVEKEAPAEAEVTFSTTPKGASLRVDGEEKGTTPATLKLRIGTYQVRLQHKGYKEHGETLEVKADGDAQIVQVALVRIEPPRDVTNSLGMKLKRIDAPAAGAVKAPYFIGVYEVTQEQYAKVMGKSPAVFHKDN